MNTSLVCQFPDQNITESQPQTLIQTWQASIDEANQNNVFCHCHSCHSEWIDSGEDQPCPDCGNLQIERIACWQFPDD
ncbi:MAG: hypothetical protein ACRC8A_18350 [Microcoleaceae cyanobacterium]